MKKVASLILALVISLGFTACGGTADSNTAPAASKSEGSISSTTDTMQSETPKNESTKSITVGVAMNAADEMRVNWLASLEAKVKDAGYTIISTNANGNANQQLADIDSLILKKPDVIIVTPTNTDVAAPGIEAIHNAGIPSIIIDFAAGTDVYDCWFGGQMVTSGTVCGEYLQSLLNADSTKKLNIGIIVGSFSMQTTQPRIDRLLEACPDLNIIATAEASFDASKAMSVTEDWLQAYPEMNAIYAFNDAMALGAIQALNSAGVDMDAFCVVGTDYLEASDEYLLSGQMAATCARDVDAETAEVLSLATKLANGESVEQNITPPQLMLVTKDTLK